MFTEKRTVHMGRILIHKSGGVGRERGVEDLHVKLRWGVGASRRGSERRKGQPERLAMTTYMQVSPDLF